MQAVVKDQYGVGKPIPLHQFVATFDQKDQAVYDSWKQMEPDLLLLRENNIQAYCQK